MEYKLPECKYTCDYEWSFYLVSWFGLRSVEKPRSIDDALYQQFLMKEYYDEIQKETQPRKISSHVYKKCTARAPKKWSDWL